MDRFAAACLAAEMNVRSSSKAEVSVVARAIGSDEIGTDEPTTAISVDVANNLRSVVGSIEILRALTTGCRLPMGTGDKGGGGLCKVPNSSTSSSRHG